MNDPELAAFLGRAKATRNGFPVDQLTLAHWREVLDPKHDVTYDDAVAALVLFDREDKQGFLRPAHIIENITRLHRHWRDRGQRLVERIYDSIHAPEVARSQLVAVGRSIDDAAKVDALLREHWDGKPERYWAIDAPAGWEEQQPKLERKRDLAELVAIKRTQEVQAISYVNPSDQWKYQ